MAVALALLALAPRTRAGAPGEPESPDAAPLLLRAAAVHVGDGRVHRPGAVLLKEGRIAAVASELEAPEGATVRDLGDAVLTPGLFDPEAAVELTAGEARGGPAAALLTAADARDPWDPWLPLLRGRGITGACLVPAPGAGPISGRAVAVGTEGPGPQGAPVLAADAALVASLASEGGGSTRRALARAQVEQLLEGAQGYREKKTEHEKKTKEAEADRGKAGRRGKPEQPPRKPPHQEAQEALLPVLDKKLPLRLEAWRREDARDALALARGRGVAISLAGCHECAQLADEIAASTAIILLRPLTAPVLDDAKGTPDPDGARRLAAAGVRLAVSAGGRWPASALWLRLAAADLAGAGVPADLAVAAMTGVAAEACGVGEKQRLLVQGASGPILVWDGDPLEPATRLLETVLPSETGDGGGDTAPGGDAGSAVGDDDDAGDDEDAGDDGDPPAPSGTGGAA